MRQYDKIVTFYRMGHYFCSQTWWMVDLIVSTKLAVKTFSDKLKCKHMQEVQLIM